MHSVKIIEFFCHTDLCEIKNDESRVSESTVFKNTLRKSGFDFMNLYTFRWLNTIPNRYTKSKKNPEPRAVLLRS